VRFQGIPIDHNEIHQVSQGSQAAVAVPLNQPQSLAFAKKFITEALSNGVMRKAYDNNGLKDLPISKQ
jgi:hypothetical protein